MDDSRQHLRRAQVQRVGRIFLRLRAALVLPAMVLFSTALSRASEPPERVFGVAVTMGVMGTLFLGEAIALRRRQVQELYLLFSMLLTQLGVSIVGALTGGLASPILPLLLAPTGVGLAAFGLQKRGRLVLVGLLVALALLLASSVWLPWPRLGSPIHEVLSFGTTFLSGALLFAALGTLSDAYVAAGASTEAARRSLLEAQHRRTAELEAVGSSVAHELKNPLAAARGLIDLVLQGQLEGKLERRLSVARQQLDRLSAVLKDYLAFSRPLRPLRLRPVELRGWLEDLVQLHQAFAVACGVELRKELPEMPQQAEADGERLGEALGNLIRNALEASSTGMLVTVRLAPQGDWLLLTVEDGGEGMSAEQVEQLGRPYQTTKTTGTGLGVALARTVITQHGGILEFVSQRGKGTLAQVSLPRQRSTGGETTELEVGGREMSNSNGASTDGI